MKTETQMSNKTYRDAIRAIDPEHAKEIIIHTAMAMAKALRPRAGAKSINSMMLEVSVHQQKIAQSLIGKIENGK